MHIRIFVAFFSSLAYSTVFLVPFRILRAVLRGVSVFAPSFQPSFLHQYFSLLACGAMGQRELRRSLQKYRTGEQSSQWPFYGTKKPFCDCSRGNVVRHCGRTAMETTALNAGQRGQYCTHRCYHQTISTVPVLYTASEQLQNVSIPWATERSDTSK